MTPAENNRRAMTYVQQLAGERVHYAAKRWCVRGHRFDEANTGRDKRGRRYCKTCRHAAVSKTRRRQGQQPRGRQWHIDEARWAELRRAANRSGPMVSRVEFAEMADIKPKVLAQWFKNHKGLIWPAGYSKPLRYYRVEVELLIQCRSDENWPRTGPNYRKRTTLQPGTKHLVAISPEPLASRGVTA